MALPEARTDKYDDYFRSIKVSQLPTPPHGQVICVRDTDTVAAATRVLGTYNILSAPVINTSASEDAGWLEKYSGTIDAVNLCYWMLEEASRLGQFDHMSELLEHAFMTRQVKEVMEMDPETTRFAPFTPLDKSNNTLLDCMILMGKYGLHRCFVVDPMVHDICGVVTQSMLVDFLHKNIHRFTDIAQQSIAKLGVGKYIRHCNIAAVNQDQTFMDAFRIIKQEGVSAVPVLDGQDKIVGVVSARDARLMVLRPTRLHFLHKPLQFFKDLHIQPLNIDAVTVRDGSTLAHVISIFEKTKVHRVFITDEERTLLGVVSLRDVIAAFVTEPRDSNISEYFAA